MAALPIGLELAGESSVPEMMATVVRAEMLVFDSVWLTDTRFMRQMRCHIAPWISRS
jgi:hypothetical protein